MLVWDNSFPLFEYKLSKENERKSISNIASNQESPTDKIHISIRDRRCWKKEVIRV